MRGPDGGLRGFPWWSHNLSRSEEVDSTEIVADCDIYHFVHLQIQIYSPSLTYRAGLPSELDKKESNRLLGIERKTPLIYGEYCK